MSQPFEYNFHGVAMVVGNDPRRSKDINFCILRKVNTIIYGSIWMDFFVVVDEMKETSNLKPLYNLYGDKRRKLSICGFVSRFFVFGIV